MEPLSFVYHPTFDRAAEGMLTDEQMIAVEDMLMVDPRRGDVIQETGGARKLRVALPGRGKSGGARLIYVYIEIGAAIHSLLCYPKNVRGNLSAQQKQALRGIVTAIKREYAP
ncbi:MAG: type II toxin-antitoxin system RelE/ParE family toxin [Thermomicrobiales bacterium]